MYFHKLYSLTHYHNKTTTFIGKWPHRACPNTRKRFKQMQAILSHTTSQPAASHMQNLPFDCDCLADSSPSGSQYQSSALGAFVSLLLPRPEGPLGLLNFGLCKHCCGCSSSRRKLSVSSDPSPISTFLLIFKFNVV